MHQLNIKKRIGQTFTHQTLRWRNSNQCWQPNLKLVRVRASIITIVFTTIYNLRSTTTFDEDNYNILVSI